MKTWITSLSGAITLTIIALLSEVWRGFLDAMLTYPIDFNNDKTIMNIVAVVYTLIFAVWTWSLVAARRGSRGGLLTAFVLNGLILLAIPVSALLFYCTGDCRANAGVFNLADTLNLIFGLVAAIALGAQLRRSTRLQPAGRPGTNPMVSDA